MSTLQITVLPDPSIEALADQAPAFVDAVYSRTIRTRAGEGVADLPNSVRESLRFLLDNRLRGSVQLVDIAAGSGVELSFLGGNGAPRRVRAVTFAGETEITVTLTRDEVAAITAVDLQPPAPAPRIQRRACFVPSSGLRVPFESSTLQIAPVTVGRGGWDALDLDDLFLSELPISTAVPWQASSWPQSRAVQWMPTHVAVDGQFGFTLPLGAGDAWMWWLAGPLPAMGIVLDDLEVVRVVRIGVPLPPFTASEPPRETPERVPIDVTEEEVARNPGVYSEDPGEYCRPFKNPERVLGERSFFVILRAEQPVISSEASVVVDPLPTLGYATPARRASLSAMHLEATATEIARVHPGAVIADTPDTSFARHALPATYLDMLRRFDRGRTVMDARNPVQWESDISRYQATTVARGHILEFRMRWKSNGYSLGTVAKTLTLAPRQTRRIQKIEWRRAEATRRQEVTQFGEQVSDMLQREREYDDAVQANLSEWSRGRSESSTTAAAVGAGFATGGFVIGGGGVHSTADSSSSQEGGRRSSASEEQRLRDSIRRYGDSLRKFESVVVTEVTQEETTTGTTEVVRNQNYAHSLTVIYYQILRHLKIETAVAGVRECLFVPFAIRPFTIARTYRWRDLLRAGLRERRHAPALDYLKDVLGGFAASSVPAGRRSDQPVSHVFGSIFMRLAVERPRDKDDGSFDAATWTRVQPFLGTPALSVFARLKALAEELRDAAFQRDQAPTIAAGWVDTMKIEAAGIPLTADFTLATRYRFNGLVRIDFSITNPSGQQPVTREHLSDLRVIATRDLPPGSVANLQSISFTYQTAQFQRTVSASQGSGDLVTVETGALDTAGATVGTIPDVWERQDTRAEMIEAVSGLVEHLNDHVEYYHKVIWWGMDRDRLFMLIDGFYVPGTSGVSIASVVERDPIAIVGNAIVFRVSSGAFLGLGGLKTPQDLFNHYVSLEIPSEPILVSLPTDGLYAQAVMDECSALEEHFGNTDWALNDPEPELGSIAPELLATRRAEPVTTQPSAFPQTIINLQNAPEAPAPSGLAGALAAVTAQNAFRDMAGLAGTQANVAAGFQTAATLASSFGAQAAALKLAETADKAHATQTADQKLATVQRAVDKNLTTPQEAQQHASKILEALAPPPASRPDPAAILSKPIFESARSIKAATSEFQLEATLDEAGETGGGSIVTAAGLVEPFSTSAKILSLDMTNSSFINCIDAANQPPDLNRLATAVIDLTDDGTAALPPYVGHNDTEMLYIGSLAKIYPLIAAFELRRRVTEQAQNMIAAGLPTTGANWQRRVFDALRVGWKPKLDAAFPGMPSGMPRFEQVLDIDAAGTASFRNNFIQWIQRATHQNSTPDAGRFIQALSYPYINGVLAAAGFFRNNAGLWISGDYNGNDWLANDAAGKPLTPRWQQPGHAVSNFTGTAQQIARYLALMAQGLLVQGVKSDEFIPLLGGPFLGQILIAAPRSFRSANGKVGIGEWGGHYSDGAIATVDRAGDPDRPIRYVVVVLGSPDELGSIRRLEVPYHDCVVSRHP